MISATKYNFRCSSHVLNSAKKKTLAHLGWKFHDFTIILTENSATTRINLIRFISGSILNIKDIWQKKLKIK